MIKQELRQEILQYLLDNQYPNVLNEAALKFKVGVGTVRRIKEQSGLFEIRRYNKRQTTNPLNIEKIAEVVKKFSEIKVTQNGTIVAKVGGKFVSFSKVVDEALQESA